MPFSSFRRRGPHIKYKFKIAELDLGHLEAALLEGRSEAAVKMELHRALDFLREHWEAEHG